MSTIKEGQLTELLVQRQSALDKAKITMMTKTDCAFFVTVCFSLKIIWNEEIPTACTNGTYIMLNTVYFMSLPPEERVFLLIHESMHVAYLHTVRLGERCHDRFNIAADHVINLSLIQRGFKMPKGGLADPQYIGMYTEHVYDLIPPPNPNQPMDRDIVPGEGTPEDIESQVQDIIMRASIQSQMQGDTPGSIPGEIQLYLNSLLDPKLPWNRILSKWLQTMSKNDYSMRKPNRRFFPKYHLPSLHSESLIDIAVAADISGSVSDEEFQVIASETAGILKKMKPKEIKLVQFDTSIHSVDRLKSIHDLSKVKFVGRGGTDIDPVLNWANENKPQLLLIFTDGGFSFSGMTTKVPVIWLIHNNPNFTASFGKVIHYKV